MVFKENKIEAAVKWVPVFVAIMSWAFVTYLTLKGLKKVWPSIVDVLIEKGITYLHGCDKEYNDLDQKSLEFGNLEVVLSLWQKTYCDCREVVERFHQSTGQITLHWIYDSRYKNWLDDYRKLCRLMKERDSRDD